MKGTSHWVSVTFEQLKKKKKDHCSFSFAEKKIFLLDSKNKEVEFIDDKKKKSILNFKIELLQ